MLLDASFLIDLMEGQPEAVALAAAIDSEGARLRLPTPVLFELWVGASRVGGRTSDREQLELLETSYEAVELAAADARSAGTLQATLRRAGRALGTVDAQLAGMALARSEELVTGDELIMGIGHGVPVRAYRRKKSGGT
ncbi:MAG: PIN domain-containing protein [Thermoplasmata archaeon]|nr:PIN domain-containing protein [Thermoplasmata archaeon]